MNYHCIVIVFAFCFGSLCHAQFRLDIREVAKGPAKVRRVAEAKNETGQVIQGIQVIQLNNIARRRVLIRNPAGNGNVVVWAGADQIPGNSTNALRKELNAELALLAIEQELSKAEIEYLRLAGERDLAIIDDLNQAVGSRTNLRVDWEELVKLQQEVQIRLKSGVGGSDTMMAKVTRRILASKADTILGPTRKERRQFAYRSVMKLIVAQVDLVTPLSMEQRDAFADRIRVAEPPPEMTQEMTYSFALKQLLLEENGPKILTPDQLKQLAEMRRGVVLGNARPHGLIKNRKSVVSSLRN